MAGEELLTWQLKLDSAVRILLSAKTKEDKHRALYRIQALIILFAAKEI